MKLSIDFYLGNSIVPNTIDLNIKNVDLNAYEIADILIDLADQLRVNPKLFIDGVQPSVEEAPKKKSHLKLVKE